jgi:sugar/nucleoside kinase (ribokinase family)
VNRVHDLSETRCDVLCAGILVADLFVPPLQRLPREGELLKVDRMLLDTGGCAANTATDLARLGVRAGVAGRVGADSFGDFIRADLGRKGIADVSGIRVSSERPTSQTVILPVTGQDRRYIHSPGANAAFSLADVDMDAALAARVLYVGGYLLLPGLSAQGLAGLFREARKRGVRTVLDVAGVDPDLGMEPLSSVLPHTDAFLPNEDEAALITRQEDPRRQSAVLMDAGAGTVIITRGARGALARTRGTLLEAGAFTVDVVDGSGSGDAFDAGYIVGMLEGWDLERSIAFASAVGASCCTRLGCTAGVFDRGQAERFIADHPLAFTRGAGA